MLKPRWCKMRRIKASMNTSGKQTSSNVATALQAVNMPFPDRAGNPGVLSNIKHMNTTKITEACSPINSAIMSSNWYPVLPIVSMKSGESRVLCA